MIINYSRQFVILLRRGFNSILFKIKSYFSIRYYSTSIISFRSGSDYSGLFLKAINDTISSQRKFDNFKRNQLINIVLEYVSEEYGSKYYNFLKEREPQLLDYAIEKGSINDKIGNPRKFKYSQHFISPTTLRYLKVASDLRLLFGDQLNLIAEIGGGYGGQALILDSSEYRTFILFDLEPVNLLVKRYLNCFVMKGSFETTTINEYHGRDKFDLVISNHCFSELPSVIQIAYIKKVLSKSSRGYLTMTTGLFGNTEKHLTIHQLKKYIPNLRIFREIPQTGKNNYIVVWGNQGILEEEIKL